MEIDIAKKYAFRDRESLSGENMNHGLEYCAAGIVIKIRAKDGIALRSGKNLIVMFVTPWGEPKKTWRSIDDVILSEITDDDFNYLEGEIESLFE